MNPPDGWLLLVLTALCVLTLGSIVVTFILSSPLQLQEQECPDVYPRYEIRYELSRGAAMNWTLAGGNSSFMDDVDAGRDGVRR